MAVIHIILALAFVACISWPYKIYRNYLIARKTGLRLIVSPFTPFEIPWQLCPLLFPSYVKSQRWFRALDQTCAWQDKNLLHEELGDCFIHVSPGFNMLCTNDPVAIDHVFKKWKEFVKPEMFKTLDFFGPNVITLNGDPWVKHRKLTAPCFNERVSSFVWNEGLRQASDMKEAWLAKPGAESNEVVLDSGAVALHVLTAAAFGEQPGFHDGLNTLPPNHELSFRDSLRTILLSPVIAAIAGQMPWLKSSVMQALLSSRIKKVQLSLREFRNYMLEAIARERKASNSSSTPSTLGRPNLLNALIRASDDEKVEDSHKSPSPQSTHMSDDELTGNMFMFAFAGHETTATTISYALALLAINPDIQDWVAAELTQVVKPADTLEYAKIQPRLKRTLAVMYETVRCFGVPPPWRDISPAAQAPATGNTTKTTSTTPPPLHLLLSNPNDPTTPTTLPIPPNTQILLNVFACHSSPTNFPHSPTTWNPRRWIQPASSSSTSGEPAADNDEQLLTNHRGFFGWGAGPRVCPGMKFAQVEFTAVLATILTEWRVVPGTKTGGRGSGSGSGEGHGHGNGEGRENEVLAREKVEKLIRDSRAQLAVCFRQPEELCIRLVKR